MNDQKVILEMLEEGKITSAEAMELIKAIDESAQQPIATVAKKIKEYKNLRILVEVLGDEKPKTKVNVNLPLKLIKVVGGALPTIAKMVPSDVKHQVEESGVNLNEIDIKEIIKAIEEGVLEDPTIVDIETLDSDQGLVRVKIYVD